MNLKKSLITLMTIICITVNVAGFMLYNRHKVVRESEDWVSHSHAVIMQSQGVYGNIEKMIARQRGYLLARQADYLSDYRQAKQDLNDSLKELIVLTTDNRKQNERLYDMQERVDVLQTILDQKIRNLQDSNQNNDFSVKEDVSEVRDLAEIIREQMRRFIDQEQLLLRDRLIQSDKQETNYFYTLFAASAISILILIVANALIMAISLKQKTAEKDLDIAKERLELAMQGTSDGVFDWNFKTSDIYFSPRFREMLGYAPNELQNDFESFDRLLHPETRAGIWEHFNAFKNGSIDEYRNEIRMHHKDGSWRWHLVRATAQSDALGNRYRFVGAHTDITEAKIAQQRLIASNKELEDFTYIASHDLRSPLVNLKGFAGEIEYGLQVVREYIDETLPASNWPKAQAVKDALGQDIQQSLDFIKASVTKMERLTRAILELSRVGRRQLRFELLDMRQIVDNCLKPLQHQINHKNVTVELSDLPDSKGDAVAIEQVFGNLIDNALKYLDPERQGHIKIGGIATVSENVYYVTDNGRGIRQEDLKKVFELFKRAGKHADIPGEGMGLSYVQTILRRHGGSIWLESELDRGTTFYFSIPHHLMKETSDV